MQGGATGEAKRVGDLLVGPAGIGQLPHHSAATGPDEWTSWTSSISRVSRPARIVSISARRESAGTHFCPWGGRTLISMFDRRMTFVRQAEPQSRFAPDTFAKQLGQTISIATPEYNGAATLVAATVAEDGHSVELTVELPPR